MFIYTVWGKGKADSGEYLWTTKPNQSVLSSDFSGSIEGGQLINLHECSWTEIKQAIAIEIDEPIEGLEIIDGSTSIRY